MDKYANMTRELNRAAQLQDRARKAIDEALKLASTRDEQAFEPELVTTVWVEGRKVEVFA